MTTGLHSTTSPSCTQDTFPHSHSSHCHASSHSIAHLHILMHLCIPSRIFVFHHTSLHSTAHLRVSPHIFVFHCDLVRIITGASIHCPASSLVHRIPFITISDYVWHHTIIILLWTLTLHHLHTQSAPDLLPSPGKALMCDLGLPCLFYNLASGSHHLSPVSSMQCMYLSL